MPTQNDDVKNESEFNPKNESEFIQACISGDLKVVMECCKKDPQIVNKPALNGSAPLMFAAQQGHKEVVEFLLKNEADINAEKGKGACEGATAKCAAKCNGTHDCVSSYKTFCTARGSILFSSCHLVA